MERKKKMISFAFVQQVKIYSICTRNVYYIYLPLHNVSNGIYTIIYTIHWNYSSKKSVATARNYHQLVAKNIEKYIIGMYIKIEHRETNLTMGVYWD